MNAVTKWAEEWFMINWWKKTSERVGARSQHNHSYRGISSHVPVHSPLPELLWPHMAALMRWGLGADLGASNCFDGNTSTLAGMIKQRYERQHFKTTQHRRNCWNGGLLLKAGILSKSWVDHCLSEGRGWVSWGPPLRPLPAALSAGGPSPWDLHLLSAGWCIGEWGVLVGTKWTSSTFAGDEFCSEKYLLLLVFSRLVMSDSLRPCGLWHTRLPGPSLSPRVCPNSCPLSQWCHPTSSSSVPSFSFSPQSFPVSGSFPMYILPVK